jgi:hypothetical protein
MPIMLKTPKKTILSVALGCLAVGMTALPMLAHHSFAAEFDGTKRVKLVGKLTKLDWMNPHIWMYLDVKDEAGQTIAWKCEGGPPNVLTRNGWNRSDLKAGEDITIEGSMAKDGSKTCNAQSITYAGRKMFAGSSEGNK